MNLILINKYLYLYYLYLLPTKITFHLSSHNRIGNINNFTIHHKFIQRQQTLPSIRQAVALFPPRVSNAPGSPG